MKIIIAPDSFKGSLTATEAAERIAIGVHCALPDAECILIPLADGGEGTVEALVKSTQGHIVHATVTDPLGRSIESFYGIMGDGETAVIEMAAASGLTLVSSESRDPMSATSYGTGELIKAALDAGCREIILGLGGSATNDGGVGAIQALGGKFLDEDGNDVGRGGRFLSEIRTLDLSGLDVRLRETSIIVASDVENPLTGPNGASAVFGPQKGATPGMVTDLDEGLYNLAEIIRKTLGIEVENVTGAGAAGGMGAASFAFLRATMKSGIELVLESVNFAEILEGASFVITGEGRIDSQTLGGKTISGVLKAARSSHVPVLALAGGIGEGGYALVDHGVTAVMSIVDKPMSLRDAQTHAGELVERASEQAVRLMSLCI